MNDVGIAAAAFELPEGALTGVAAPDDEEREGAASSSDSRLLTASRSEPARPRDAARISASSCSVPPSSEDADDELADASLPEAGPCALEGDSIVD